MTQPPLPAPRDEQIEAMARAICDDEWEGSQPWDHKPESFKNRYRSYARVAYAALAAASPSAGEGWVLVPREPTEAMAGAGWRVVRDGIAINDDCDRTMRHAYRAMIAAAPSSKTD